jgi:hypothetical protein
MNRRTCLLLTLSILVAVGLSCAGPETGALNLKIATESGKSSSTQGSLDTETPKSEIDAKLLESNHSRKSRIDKMPQKKEWIALAGLFASFL